MQSKQKKEIIRLEQKSVISKTRNQKKKIISTKSWPFKKIAKVNDLLARLGKNKRRSKLSGMKGDITRDPRDIKRNTMKNSMPTNLIT